VVVATHTQLVQLVGLSPVPGAPISLHPRCTDDDQVPRQPARPTQGRLPPHLDDKEVLAIPDVFSTCLSDIVSARPPKRAGTTGAAASKEEEYRGGRFRVLFANISYSDIASSI
jgi:hypothetical protein